MKVWILVSAILLCLVAGWLWVDLRGGATVGPSAERRELAPTDVTRDRDSLDATAGQSARVGFTLPEDADVTVEVLGPNREVVRTLLDAEPRAAGRVEVGWDGRDWAGRAVPDEAWSFRVVAEDDHVRGVYDAWADSGGDPVNPWNLEYRASDDAILYSIPKPCRVLVRTGIDQGPLLRTVVNWEPRVAGEIREPWTGKDVHGVRRFSGEERADFMVQCVGLPENAIVTYGNREVDYRSWYLEHGARRPVAPAIERGAGIAGIASDHYGMPVHLDKDPPLALSFPELGAAEAGPGVPLDVPADLVLVRVDVPEPVSARFVADQRFELVAFLDDERIAEVEMAQLPCNWGWDASLVEPGEHWLSVNLVTFRQHVGIASQRVRVMPAPDLGLESPGGAQ
jgi:hypothetical protein